MEYLVLKPTSCDTFQLVPETRNAASSVCQLSKLTLTSGTLKGSYFGQLDMSGQPCRKVVTLPRDAEQLDSQSRELRDVVFSMQNTL